MNRYLVIFAIVLVTMGFATIVETAEKPSGQTHDSYRIVNMVDRFQAYYQKCLGKDWENRLTQWDSMLEDKYPQFFQDAIYRGKKGLEKDRYKEVCIRLFWDEVAPRMTEINRLNSGFEQRIHRMVTEFRKHLPDFSPTTDFYITISFSFRGKALVVGKRNVLAVGLEAFTKGNERQVDITLAHEMFHLYHFQFFQPGGGLYRSLWTEGLATYASAVVVPGQRRSVYLGFPVEKMNRCYELLHLLTEDLRKNLGRNDHRLKRVYFGAEPNDTMVPPEAGYYVGLLIMEKLVNEIPLSKLTRMPADKVLPLLAMELTAFNKINH